MIRSRFRFTPADFRDRQGAAQASPADRDHCPGRPAFSGRFAVFLAVDLATPALPATVAQPAAVPRPVRSRVDSLASTRYVLLCPFDINAQMQCHATAPITLRN
jgi:hypothetical protein